MNVDLAIAQYFDNPSACVDTDHRKPMRGECAGCGKANVSHPQDTNGPKLHARTLLKSGFFIIPQTLRRQAAPWPMEGNLGDRPLRRGKRAIILCT